MAKEDPKVTDQFTANMRREREADMHRLQQRRETLVTRAAELKQLLAACEAEIAEHDALLHRPPRVTSSLTTSPS